MPSAKTGRPSRRCPSAEASGRPAIRSPAAVLLFLAAAALGLAADLLSKHYVFGSLLNSPALRRQLEGLRAEAPGLSPEDVLHDAAIRPYVQRDVFPGVRLTLSTNPGVVFGLPVPRTLVAAATVAAFVLIGFLFATSDSGLRSVHLALAFILAGAIGNLYDRLLGQVVLPGVGSIRHQVRDFIDCRQLYYPWVFNVADILLVVGVALLMLHWWLARRSRTTKPQSAKTHPR